MRDNKEQTIGSHHERSGGVKLHQLLIPRCFGEFLSRPEVCLLSDETNLRRRVSHISENHRKPWVGLFSVLFGIGGSNVQVSSFQADRL